MTSANMPSEDFRSLPAEYSGLPASGRYEYSPLPARPTFTWPGGRFLAFYVAVNLEHFSFGVGKGPAPSPEGAGDTPQRASAWREYGVRVGVWRLFDMFDELGIPAVWLVNAYAALEYPQIIDRIRSRGDEMVAHGRTNSERFAGRWRHDAVNVVRETTEILRVANAGESPHGWMSPGREEPPYLLDVLASEGYSYVLNWPLDDQPVGLRAGDGEILSIPYPVELNDLVAQMKRGVSAQVFYEMVELQFQEMQAHTMGTGQVMAVSIHPYLAGQPYQIACLRKALTNVTDARKDVWIKNSGSIASAFVADRIR